MSINGDLPSPVGLLQTPKPMPQSSGVQEIRSAPPAVLLAAFQLTGSE